MEKIGFRYLRVSTADQEGGLDMQDQITQESAGKKNIPIKQTFKDEAISGGRDKDGNLAIRRGFDELKNKIRINSLTNQVFVFIYDLSRIGRDPFIGLEFVDLCWKHNVTVVDRVGGEHTFETWEKRLFARIMFDFSTADKEKKNNDTFNGMINAMKNGRYVLRQVKGYEYKSINGTKILSPKPFEAEIVKIALENYAGGVFNTLTDIYTHFKENGLECSNNYKYIRKFLTNPIYAGYYEYEPWEIPITRGIHEPLIEWDTHLKILEKLDMKKKQPYQSKRKEDFPLRKFVKCSECGGFLTVYWAKGTHQKYNYYRCQAKNCSLYWKDIPGKNADSEFEELLKSLKPSQFVLDTAKEVFEQVYESRQKDHENSIKKAKKAIDDLEKQIQKRLDQLPDIQVQSVIQRYSQEIDKMEKEKIDLAEFAGKQSLQDLIDQTKYRTTVQKGLKILENPHKMWTLGVYDVQRIVLKIIFGEGVTLLPDGKYRTVTFSQFYQVIRDFSEKKDVWWTKYHPNTNEQRDLIKIIIDMRALVEALPQF